MNVAIFASAFYPHVGGVEELVRQLAQCYRERGMGAIVLTNRWPRTLPTEENYEGIPVYRLAMRTPDGSLKAHVNYCLTYRSIRAQTLRILRKHRVDLLHVQCVSSNGHYALAARRALGLPLIITAQGERTMDAGKIYEHSAFMNRVLRMCLEEADYITACSRNTLDDIERWFGQPFGERSSVIYNGIRMDDFENGKPFVNRRPYVLGIGRLVPQKGFDVLLEAFARSRSASHDLIVAGEGPERKALEALARQRGIQDRVQFIGRADRSTAVALFEGCEFFVLPSRQEPMGIVNFEAMAAGKAVIASRTGGVPEIVSDRETGLLVPPENAEALAAAISRLISDTPLRTRWGNAGSVRVRDFAWEKIAQQYIEVYGNVQSRRQRTRHAAATESGRAGVTCA
jgi:glycogen(starch) synthase